MAILQEAAEKGIGGQYCETRTLLADIRASYEADARTQAGEIVERVTKTDLLLLDDLGAERLTEWGQDTVHLIVNGRYNADRATLCTTGFPTDAGASDALWARIGGKLYARLHEMCDVIEFDGADYGQAGENPSPERLSEMWRARARLAQRPAPKRLFAPHVERPGA